LWGEKLRYPISVYGNLESLKRRLLRLRGVSACVIEIKPVLNYEALGQILTDKCYFPEEYPNVRVEGYAILCNEKDEVIEAACRRQEVRVFRANRESSLDILILLNEEKKYCSVRLVR